MVIASDPRPATGSWEFILSEDEEAPPEEQTTWTLRPLTTTEWCRVSDRIVGGDSGPYSMALQMIQAGGLVSVANFKDSAGVEVKVERDPVTGYLPEDFLERLEPRHLIQIGNSVLERTTLSRVEVEKPEPSPAD